MRVTSPSTMIVGMLADQLALLPRVDVEDAEACAERWRSEKMAEIAITLYGAAARHAARAVATR